MRPRQLCIQALDCVCGYACHSPDMISKIYLHLKMVILTARGLYTFFVWLKNSSWFLPSFPTPRIQQDCNKVVAGRLSLYKHWRYINFEAVTNLSPLTALHQAHPFTFVPLRLLISGTMAPPATAKYDWILAIATIAFVFASFGNGANDVANSYATSVAARTLTMAQAGIISVVTEFVGAVALGARVTSTIKNGIMSIDKFTDRPAALMLVMSCAEVGNASWLMLATRLGFPVSTTHTAVGSLIGAGIAAQSPIKWAWKSGSVSQIAASWLISPLLSGAFGAIVFATVKYSVLERKDPLKWAMRLIPIYLALTGAILALFIVIEAPTAPSLEEFGAGKAIGIIFGVFGACLLIAYVFFMPYFERRILKKDTQVKAYHIPLGPLLRKEGPPLYWPSKGDSYVDNYYADTYRAAHTNKMDEGPKKEGHTPTELDPSKTADVESPSVTHVPRKPMPEPYERFVGPVQHLSWANPTKWWGWFKFITLQGVTRDVLSHDSSLLHAVHSSAKVYDIRVEHLWTYCQVSQTLLPSSLRH